MVYIYVLRCEEGKYYIGRANNIYKRISEHFNANGSEWTKKFRPIDIEEVIPDLTDFDEDFITKKYMQKYGIENVRGGSYSKINLRNEEYKLLCKEMKTANSSCFRCGSKKHFEKKCPYKVSKPLNGDGNNLKALQENSKEITDKIANVCLNCGMVGYCNVNCVLNSYEIFQDIVDITYLDIDYIWKVYKDENYINDDDLVKISYEDYENIWTSFEDVINDDICLDICLICSEHGHCMSDCPNDYTKCVVEEKDCGNNPDENRMLLLKRLR